MKRRGATAVQEARWVILRAATVKKERGRLAFAGEVEEVDQAAVPVAVVKVAAMEVMEENTVLLEIVCQPLT